MSKTHQFPQAPSRLPDPGQEAGHAKPEALPGALDSSDLFKGEKSVVIQHMGAIYRLQATRLGKLILTK